MKKLILTSLVMMSFSFNSIAGGGSADTGGGNAVGGILLDLYENKDTSAIEVTKLKAYKEVLGPLLKKVDAKIPGFTESLFEPSKDKKWLFDPKPLSRKQCLNSSTIETAKTVVGCQNNIEVRLSKNWYSNVDSTQQAALLLHELLRGHALMNDRIDDSEVSFLTRTIFAIDSHGEDELQEIFAKTGMGLYATTYDYEYVSMKALAPVYKDVCVNKEERSQSLNKLRWASLSGEYTTSQRSLLHGFVEAANNAFYMNETKVVCKLIKEMLDKY